MSLTENDSIVHESWRFLASTLLSLVRVRGLTIIEGTPSRTGPIPATWINKEEDQLLCPLTQLQRQPLADFALLA
jgi:hypothetical protein